MTAEFVALSDSGVREADTVFLHGYACSARDWSSVADAMPGTSLLVDFPGHGTQAATPSEDFGQLVDRTATLLAGLPRPAVVAGHSMGGMVAMKVAATYPGLIKNLVLAEAFPLLSAVVDEFGGAEDPGDPFGYGSVIDRRTPPEVQANVRASMTVGVQTAGAALHAELMGLDLRADLASIICPALVLIGDRHGVRAADAGGLADRLGFGALRDRRVQLVPSHHFVMLEQPAKVARQIEEFLLDQEATPKGMK